MSNLKIKLPAKLLNELDEWRGDKKPGEWVSDERNPETLWRYMATERLGSRRWQADYNMIIENQAGELYSIAYSLGLTENQDNDLPWRKDIWDDSEPDDVEAWKVEAIQVTTTEYRMATQ